MLVSCLILALSCCLLVRSDSSSAAGKYYHYSEEPPSTSYGVPVPFSNVEEERSPPLSSYGPPVTQRPQLLQSLPVNPPSYVFYTFSAPQTPTVKKVSPVAEVYSVPVPKPFPSLPLRIPSSATVVRTSSVPCPLPPLSHTLPKSSTPILRIKEEAPKVLSYSFSSPLPVTSKIATVSKASFGLPPPPTPIERVKDEPVPYSRGFSYSYSLPLAQEIRKIAPITKVSSFSFDNPSPLLYKPSEPLLKAFSYSFSAPQLPEIPKIAPVAKASFSFANPPLSEYGPPLTPIVATKDEVLPSKAFSYSVIVSPPEKAAPISRTSYNVPLEIATPPREPLSLKSFSYSYSLPLTRINSYFPPVENPPTETYAEPYRATLPPTVQKIAPAVRVAPLPSPGLSKTISFSYSAPAALPVTRLVPTEHPLPYPVAYSEIENFTTATSAPLKGYGALKGKIIASPTTVPPVKKSSARFSYAFSVPITPTVVTKTIASPPGPKLNLAPLKPSLEKEMPSRGFFLSYSSLSSNTLPLPQPSSTNATSSRVETRTQSSSSSSGSDLRTVDDDTEIVEAAPAAAPAPENLKSELPSGAPINGNEEPFLVIVSPSDQDEIRGGEDFLLPQRPSHFFNPTPNPAVIQPYPLSPGLPWVDDDFRQLPQDSDCVSSNAEPIPDNLNPSYEPGTLLEGAKPIGGIGYYPHSPQGDSGSPYPPAGLPQGDHLELPSEGSYPPASYPQGTGEAPYPPAGYPQATGEAPYPPAGYPQGDRLQLPSESSHPSASSTQSDQQEPSSEISKLISRQGEQTKEPTSYFPPAGPPLRRTTEGLFLKNSLK